MHTPDYYMLLGVDRTATTQVIKRAYHQLAQRYHPDLHPGDAAAEAMMKQLNQAAEILCDPLRRAHYNRSYKGSVANKAFTAAEMTQGYDVVYEMTITPQEASAGTVRTFAFHASDGCPYRVTVHIPPGTRAGTCLRVAGAGGPARRGSGRGDFYAVVRIVPG